MSYTPINEQLRSLLDREAFDDLAKPYLVSEVLKALKLTGGDLADNTKGGSGDLNAKAASGDLNSKAASGDLNAKSASGDLGASGAQVTAVVELVKAAMAMGRAKAIVAELRAVQTRLSGEDRARLQKSINNLETELAIIEDSSGRYAAAIASKGRSDGAAGGRDVHLHVHLGA